MADKHWHMLTVRFASDQPIMASAAARNPDPPGVAIGEALRGIFHLDTIWLDQVHVFPDDLPASDG